MKFALPFLVASIVSFPISVQANTMNSLSQEQYQAIQQPGLDKTQLIYDDIAPVLAVFQANPLYRFTELGKSVMGTPIWQIDVGSGPIKIFAWSQMHGNESTATAALMDLLNFISADEQQAWRDTWLKQVTLRIVPMVNPDGAALSSRYNSMGIDINRDAKSLQSPESRILMQVAKEFKPHFGLNLHDQNRFYAVGDTNKQATISLLAPAFNEAKDIDEPRKKAMQLIGDMADLMAKELPGYLAKYNDTFSWRSFGDTFAGMGISTVLIESGGHPNDDNRQVARKLNTKLLIMSIESIASGAYEKQSLAAYHAIPFNRDGGVKDVLIDNLEITVNGHKAIVDLALELDVFSSQQGRIRDLGDLSIFGAYHQFDAKGLTFQPPKAYELTKNIKLDNALYLSLLSQGYSHFTGDAKLLVNKSDFPVVINAKTLTGDTPQRGRLATFLLSNKDGVQFALINGQLLDIKKGKLLYPFGS